MGRARRPWAALVALALAPFTLAGGGMEPTCESSVDLGAFGTAAEATTALQAAVDAADLCMGLLHVVEVTGDVTLTAPLVHRHAVPVVLRGVGAERSVLSGGGAHRILVVDPIGPSGAADLTLEHVELRDGRADEALGPSGYVDGGAVWAPEGAGIVVTVRDGILADNVALEAGGAIAADAVVLEDVAVVGNTAELGGALSVATLVARDATFEGNGSVGLGACGAAGATVCTADAEVSTLEGGAVRAGLSMVLENVTFHDNRAEVGGAIWMDASPVVTELELGASEPERGIDATFVTFVANAAGGAADSGAHVAGVDTDGFGPVDLVPATFRASLFLDAVVLDDGIVIEEVPAGLDCAGLQVAVDGATGSRTAGPGCPGAAIEGTAGTLLEGPDDHGALGRTFLPAAAVGPTGGAAPTSGGAALIDAVDCSVGTWPDEDQRGVARPQGGACDVGAVERTTDDPGDDPGDDPVDDDERDDDPPRSTSPVPTSVPSGIGPPSPWWRGSRG